jgi:hypothetical protein
MDLNRACQNEAIKRSGGFGSTTLLDRPSDVAAVIAHERAIIDNPEEGEA